MRWVSDSSKKPTKACGVLRKYASRPQSSALISTASWTATPSERRERAAEEYAERTKREVEVEARRAFRAGEETAARVMSRGVGRMRVSKK